MHETVNNRETISIYVYTYVYITVKEAYQLHLAPTFRETVYSPTIIFIEKRVPDMHVSHLLCMP